MSKLNSKLFKSKMSESGMTGEAGEGSMVRITLSLSLSLSLSLPL